MSAPAGRAPGTLVRARDRDWVVLPGSTEDLVLAQPLDGDREFVAALFPGEVSEPGFGRPRALPGEAGDFASASLLRTALRIASTAGAGPFRSLNAVAVEPRRYQLVPLMMALRMDPVRLLIGDDVGIGKTVESALIAKELMEQGSARNMTVLCSPSLAEQWQRELRDKFDMDPELVLPSTAARLQKAVDDPDRSIFDHYRVTVVSTDFIKQDERRDAFRRHCPDVLIVDEAHTCVGTGGNEQQKRYELLSALADRTERDRHLILVTATPHSGDPQAFAKLTGLLDPSLRTLDTTRSADRDKLARHFVQRRRHDIKRYVGQDTPFPDDRDTQDALYRLDADYARFVADILAHTRDQVRGPGGDHHQRMSWWTALTLLRCVLSSPAAAAATLRARSLIAATRTPVEADKLGRAAAFELTDDETTEGMDVVPGSLPSLPDEPDGKDATTTELPRKGRTSEAKALADFADRADALAGPETDAKLRTLVDRVKWQLVDGYDPIVFCHYIPTAEYVAQHLKEELGRSASVAAVTGTLHPDARQARVDELTARRGRHVLVATDCLSEGVNLQEHFGAVIHYDLSWNPTRHLQRAGRVDRFGQPRRRVREITVYDTDTGIDGLVLKVLIQKHKDIADQTGVAVLVPDQGRGVLEALASALLLRGKQHEGQLTLDFEDDPDFGRAREALHKEWESAAERESKVLTKFAHVGLRPEEVETELEALRQALGDPGDIATFTRESLAQLGAQPIGDARDRGFKAPVDPLPTGLKHALGYYEDTDQTTAPGGAVSAKAKGRAKTAARDLVFREDLPVARGEHTLSRTDPAVRALARYLLDAAVDTGLPAEERPARRLGVIRTGAVDRRTVLLLARYRFRLTLPGRTAADESRDLVADDAQVLAWRTGDDGGRTWLSDEETAALLTATPDLNTLPALRDQQAARAAAELDDEEIEEHLKARGLLLADRLRDAHQRVREAAGQRGRERGAAAVRRIDVQPSGDPDLLGVYVYLSAPAAQQPAPQGDR
ncbi:DEAD/DEAH box helicase [Streptomyces parvulus]|uniref:helicase-related protein n=1 Tax=Streptomyces parvulus TaxID=146923 RepID=UPI001E47DE6F|nr:helicase-related protein [Streptomyces parvulus]MCC9157765.1 DEAD/DEAH box helicase [Streptomyces parvulus]MCE7689604.1 DEAD/DEAH box helicase [Streptomyces parvulus]